ncbi:cache domain-containing protein [Cognatishimia activa]|uniref:histidine kinase n=1 Tax=Cognatishimia activa TaxID=1715691 RepID=A0A0P1IP62_9RHOB|nr:cache domain-containing protein [Cognatishimia activa]CUJ28504.1 Signal transduction histidine-protein kinase/phosphatase DegS [Cognatishimia activa]CUK25252.1 Signal transduction histidine-protein kinase/phosphatase DegS [Cognatishimia activa]
MTQVTSSSPLSYAQKLFLLATVPLILAVAAISIIVAHQSRQLAEREIQTLEEQLIEAKKAELKNYLSIARTAFGNIYGLALPDDEEAKLQVSQILAALIYGQDGYFFVYDYDGTNIVSPRQTELIGKNWIDLTDANGTPITEELIRIARTGGGYHSFEWPKPSTGETASMVTFVLGLQDWRWAVGTGIFIDDIQEEVAAARAGVEARIQRTFYYIGGITLAAVLLVFFSGIVINVRERRLADAKLKKLTQRVFDAQEEERGRVARELHDGISQILVGVRYALDSTRRRMNAGDDRAEDTLDRGMEHLTTAIHEVRRISRDLRPGILDDLGLGPALRGLIDEFTTRTGVETEIHTVPFRNRLNPEAKFSLYRIAQEALTNIERHANATKVVVDLRGHKRGATMRISDNGTGFPQHLSRSEHIGGLGLRNMQERVEQLNGTLKIMTNKSGTVIVAEVPLNQMLSPEADIESQVETTG